MATRSGEGEVSTLVSCRSIRCSKADGQMKPEGGQFCTPTHVRTQKGTLVDRAGAEALVFRPARQQRDVWATWPAPVAALIAAQVAAGVEKPSGKPGVTGAGIMQRALQADFRERLAALADLGILLS